MARFLEITIIKRDVFHVKMSENFKNSIKLGEKVHFMVEKAKKLAKIDRIFQVGLEN
jgi:hypothetical protein